IFDKPAIAAVDCRQASRDSLHGTAHLSARRSQPISLRPLRRSWLCFPPGRRRLECSNRLESQRPSARCLRLVTPRRRHRANACETSSTRLSLPSNPPEPSTTFPADPTSLAFRRRALLPVRRLLCQSRQTSTSLNRLDQTWNHFLF